jgi:uncharacterized membrane protein
MSNGGISFAKERNVRMDFDRSKNLGGIGALLMVIGPLAGAAYGLGSVLSLVGVILLLIGLKGFADYYSESGIFNNWLYGIILIIVGGVVSVVVFAVTAFALLSEAGLDWAGVMNNPSSFATYFADTANLNTILGFVGGLLGALIIFFIMFVVSAFLIRKSLNSLSTKSGVRLFGTAGLLILIGAVLTIILIGLVIFWVGMILVTAAFFQMRRPTTPPSTATITPPQ